MKYYLGKVLERNGDMEYTDSYLFETDGDPSKLAEKIAMGWRGGDEDEWDEDQDGWWCDSTLIFNDGYREIPKEDFDVLQKYIPVLGV
jgi:hypothetical protein